MAKQGSIKHYRQTGTVVPATLPYGEIAVLKDGKVLVGNETETPVQMGIANNMSTVEHWTGERDLEEDKIYEKTLLFAATGETTILNIADNIHNIVGINETRSYAYVRSHDEIFSVNTSRIGYGFQVRINKSTKKLTFYIVGGYSATDVVITVCYTCTDR